MAFHKIHHFVPVNGIETYGLLAVIILKTSVLNKTFPGAVLCYATKVSEVICISMKQLGMGKKRLFGQ